MRHLVLLLCFATAALAQPRDAGVLHVKSDNLGTTLEVVTWGTSFTQLSGDSTFKASFAPESKFDSIASGNSGAATLTAVWSGAATADSSANNLFFRDYSGDGTVSSISGVFGNAFSARYAGYLERRHASLFDVAGNWTITAFAAGFSAGNPGVGTLQTVFSVYNSPDIVQIGFQRNGYVFGRISDDGRATWDSVAVATDVYDSLYHFVALQSKAGATGADSLRLTVDGTTAAVAFSNAATSLTLDTVSVFSFRSVSDCRCRADAIWYVEDTTGVNSEMRRFAWQSLREATSLAADSASMRVYGIATDSTRRDTLLELRVQEPITTSRSWHAFETAHLDSEEVLPILVFATAQTPRGSLLDSIPAGRMDYDIAHLLFDQKRETPQLTDVQFHHETAVDTTLWELRVYPSIEDTRDLTDGYYMPVTARLFAGQNTLHTTLDLPVSGFVVVYGRSVAGSATGSVTLRYRRY